MSHGDIPPRRDLRGYAGCRPRNLTDMSLHVGVRGPGHLSRVSGATTSPPQNKDPSALTILGPDVTAATQGVTADGFVAVMTFKGMGLRDPVVTGSGGSAVYSCPEGLDATKITILVSDPGYDASGNATTRYRVIKGRKSLRNPYPVAAATSTVYPAKSFISNAEHAYYSVAGITLAATMPTHTSGSATPSGATGECCFVADNLQSGFVQALSGSDCQRWFILDGPIYSGTTVVSVTVGAGAYNDGALTSNARTMIVGSEVTNSSTRAYELPLVWPVSIPHARSTGSLTFELHADHAHAQQGRQVACTRARARDLAASTATSWVTCASPSLSAVVTSSGPAGLSTEVYSHAINTSGLAAGDSFVEYEVYPWLGTNVFRSATHGLGADWQANTAYPINWVVRFAGALHYASTAGTSGASAPSADGAEGPDTLVWAAWGSDMTTQIGSSPQARWHFYNDPSDVLAAGYCFVDPSGTAAGTAGVYTSFAAAYAAKGTLANCYATVKAAVDALVTYNTTPGGGKTAHADAGSGHIYLKSSATKYQLFSASLASIAKGAEWLHLHIDPDATPNVPGASGGVELTYGATSKIPMKRLYFHPGFYFDVTSGGGSGANNFLFDPGGTDGTTTIRQAAYELVFDGFKAVFNASSSNPSLAQRVGISWHLNADYSGAFLINGEGNICTCVMIAGCKVDVTAVGGGIACQNMIGNKLIGPNTVGDARTSFKPTPLFLILADSFCTAGATTGGCTVKLLDGTAADKVVPTAGASVIGNVISVYDNTGGNKCIQLAADGSKVDVNNVLVMNNTFLGERTNLAYDDQNTDHPTRVGWFVRHNLFDDVNVVSDAQTHTTSKNGIKCDNFWPRHSVAAPRNVYFRGSLNGTTPSPSLYLDAVDPTSYFGGGYAASHGDFVDDKSRSGASPGQGGDFHPKRATSVITAVTLANDAYGASVQTRKYALDGTARLDDQTGAAGAYEYV